MNKYTKQPFLKITILLTLGILSSKYYPSNLTSLLLSATSFILILIFIRLLSQKFKLLKTILICFAITILGYVIHASTYYIQNQEIKSLRKYQCEVLSTKRTTNNQIRSIAKIKYIKTKTESRLHHQKINLIFNKDSKVEVGDIIEVSGCPKKIKKTKSKNGFDYQSFMNNKNIFYEHRVKIFRKIGYKNSIISISHKVRKYLQEILKSKLEKRPYSILNAMLLGDKSNISDKEISLYRNTGAMHVLAVSGLHVGIISQLILLLLGFIKRHNKNIYLILSIVLLWCYAFISGLSPSIIRASIMFSLLMITAIYNFQQNTINTVFASAFLILIFSPNQIFSLGFQFSYVAVIGIIGIYPLLNKIIPKKTKTITYLFQMAAVSLAAQIALSPLLLYYFGQIPSYGILSNFTVVTFASLSLILGIIILLTSPLPSIISETIGIIYNKLYEINNYFLELIHELPFQNIKIEQMSLIDLFGASIMVFSCILFIKKKNANWAISFFLSLNIMLGLNVYEKIKSRIEKLSEDTHIKN